jgi:serine/threonine protein kinase
VNSSQTLVHSSTAASRDHSERPAPRDPLLLGRYRLLELLGAGGFGVVWRARDELLIRDVAVKRIPIADAPQPPSRDGSACEHPGGRTLGGTPERAQAGRRAAREARATARLSHPSIVSLY